MEEREDLEDQLIAVRDEFLDRDEDLSSSTWSTNFLEECCFLDVPVVITVGNHRVFMGPDDPNGYGYVPVRLYWAEAGFQAPSSKNTCCCALCRTSVPMKRVALVSRSLDPFSLPAADLVPISLRFHC